MTIGDEKPEPLDLEQVEEVVAADDQVHEDVAEPVHEEGGAETVGSTEVGERAETRLEVQERLTDLGTEDKWQRFLKQTAEDVKEEELGEPRRTTQGPSGGPSPV